MLVNFFQKYILICGFFLFTTISFGQNSSTIELTLESEISTNNSSLMDVLISIKNNDNTPFHGTLKADLPKGVKNISNTSTSLDIEPNDNRFISFKVWLDKELEAGSTTITFNLLNDKNEIVTSKSTVHTIKENNRLRLSVENPVIYMSNPNDSIRIKTNVSNIGNRKQDITLVYKIPELVGETNFFEIKGTLDVKDSETYTFSFLPTKRLLRLEQFTVQITGMRSELKELFANTTIQVLNVTSNQQFIYSGNNSWNLGRQRNTFTASYRSIGSGSSVYQLQGAADFNLPAGFVSFEGNLYHGNNDEKPIVTNTILRYQLNDNKLSLGNISKPFEMSLFGRGASVEFEKTKMLKSFEIGFIDQQYNLIQQDGFLKNGYGVYAKAEIPTNGRFNQANILYVFKDDPFEQAKHNVVSNEINYYFNSNWHLNTKLHAGISNYSSISKTFGSYAAEAAYNGRVNSFSLFGNYFISSDYFPGNRRGITQIQQSASKAIANENSLTANIFYSNFSPRSPLYTANIDSDNIRADIGIQFSKKNNFGGGVFAQHQYESNSSFNHFNTNNDKKSDLKAYRLIENINWSSSNQKHFINLNLDNGIIKYPIGDKIHFQGRAQLSYNFNKFYTTLSYQRGSYFLSEFYNLYTQNSSQTFQRLLFSFAYQNSLLNNKLNVNTGFTYSEDPVITSSPSLYMNLNYAVSNNLTIYTNASWFQSKSISQYYDVTSLNRLFTIEAGIQFNLNKRSAVSSGKKSKISATVFYDNNNNSLFDEGDEVAPNYLTTFNIQSFLTDEKGKITYKSVPFGKYDIRPIVQEGWYPALSSINVDSYSKKIDIPLHKNGTLIAKIEYNFDEKKVVQFDPVMGGIVFLIMQNGKLIQKVNTDADGNFTVFLPTGTYDIVMQEKSLPQNAYCENTVASVFIESGKVIKLDSFIILVKQKTINVRKFGS